jgi:excisionase family DNA binding protein
MTRGWVEPEERSIAMAQPTAGKVLRVSELCSYLRVHRSTIYRLLKRGQIPGFKIGSDWRFNLEAIDRWRLSGDLQDGESSVG